MKVLYFGHLVSNEESNKNVAVSPIANNMQQGIFTEIKKEIGENLTCYSYVPLVAFPKGKRLFYSSKKVKINEDLTVTSFAFINIIFLKQLCIMLSTLYVLVKFLMENKNQKISVITYNVSTFFTIPLIIASNFFDFEKVCYVVDIQEDILKKEKWIADKFRIADNKFRMKFFNKYDSYLTFNVNVLTKAGINKPYQQVYVGAYSSSHNDEINSHKINKNRLVVSYTGILEPYYNLENLVEAIKMLGDTFILNVYGNGSLKTYIEEVSSNNKNINYFGYVTNEEAREAQKKSDILFSLLEPNTYFGKYAFPGKIFEYILSGKPVISTLPASLPSEMAPFLSIVDDTEVVTIMRKIQEITKTQNSYYLAMKKSENGIHYIQENCSWKVQAMSIIKFLNKLGESR